MYGYLFPSYQANLGVTPTEAANTAERVIMPIDNRLQHLELACAGLWELLKSKHGYTDADLMAAIQTVDSRDGVVDGKVGHASQTCPHCHRKVLTRNNSKCGWCGGDLMAAPL